MKKIITMVLAMCMIVFSLAACSNNDTASSDDTGTDTSADVETTAAEEVTVDFPTDDITLIVPYAAGGTTDLMARALSEKVGEILGVNIIIQNVEGGGGTTGTSQAVNSDPDGYTLAIPSNAGYLINPVVNDVGYTWETTTPICIVSEIEIAIGVSADSEYESLEDLLAAAAEDTLVYCTPGANSSPNLLAEYVALEAGITWSHSPNSSTPEMITELIGGHIDFVCVNSPSFDTYVEDGSVRLLAITGDERSEDYPDVPTFSELGYDYPASVYFCIVGPDGMDEAVVQIISDAVEEAMADETVQETFESLSFPLSFQNYEEFAERIEDDVDMYTSILEELDVIE